LFVEGAEKHIHLGIIPAAPEERRPARRTKLSFGFLGCGKACGRASTTSTAVDHNASDEGIKR
jgi:hypothetical protein